MAATWLEDVAGVDIIDGTGTTDTKLPRRASIRFTRGVNVDDNAVNDTVDVEVDADQIAGKPVARTPAPTVGQVLGFDGSTWLPQTPAGGGGGTISSSLISGGLLTTAGTAANQIAVARGYYASGDGGGGVFYWDSASTATADGGTIIAPGGGAGRWVRIFQGALNVRWFGAKGDDSADDTAAIQATINAAVKAMNPYGSGYGGEVFIPRGMYRVTATINIPDVHGLIISGEGGGGPTLIRWDSNTTTDPVILCDGYHVTIKRLWFRNTTKKALCAIKFTSNTGNWITTGCVVEDVSIGGNLHSWEYGIQFKNDGTAGDNNNDLHHLTRVRVTAYDTAAFHINGSQIHGIRFDHCEMFGQRVGLFGVWAEVGTFFHWHDGTGGQHTNYDFWLQSFFLTTSIDGWNSEQSTALVNAATNSGTGGPLTVSNCRFESEYIDATNGTIIRCGTAGPLTVTGCTFASYTTGLTPRINLSGLSDTPVAIVYNNVFRGGSEYSESLTYAAGGQPYIQGWMCWSPQYAPNVHDLGNQVWVIAESKYRRLSLGFAAMQPRSLLATGGKVGHNAFVRAAFSGDITSKTVIFTIPEPDANYFVVHSLEGTNLSAGLFIANITYAYNQVTFTFNQAAGASASGHINFIVVRTG